MRNVILSGLIGSMLALAGAAPRADDRHETGFLFREISLDGRSYKYAVYVPRDYDPTKAWPAVVFLNGSGECGTDGQKQLAIGLGPAIMLNPDRWPCIAVFPQKPDQGKQWEDFGAMVIAQLDAAAKEWNLDPDRVCLTGLSQGGHGVWTIGAAHPKRFASLVPICGYMWGTDPVSIAPRLKSIPQWAFHGAADPIVKPDESRRMIDTIKSLGGDAKLTVYPNVEHASWDPAYADPDLPNWIFSKKR